MPEDYDYAQHSVAGPSKTNPAEQVAVPSSQFADVVDKKKAKWKAKNPKVLHTEAVNRGKEQTAKTKSSDVQDTHEVRHVAPPADFRRLNNRS